MLAVTALTSADSAVEGEVIHSGSGSPRRLSGASVQPLPLSLPSSAAYGEVGDERGDRPGQDGPSGSIVRSSCTCWGRRVELGAGRVEERGGGSDESRQS